MQRMSRRPVEKSANLDMLLSDIERRVKAADEVTERTMQDREREKYDEMQRLMGYVAGSEQSRGSDRSRSESHDRRSHQGRSPLESLEGLPSVPQTGHLTAPPTWSAGDSSAFGDRTA